jgi:hypothetical protein
LIILLANCDRNCAPRLLKATSTVVTSPNDFDPLAVVVDWLDACRSADLNALLELYDTQAILECSCESVSLTDRGH